MRITKTWGRLGALLAILGGFVAAFAGTASASTAVIPRPAPDGGSYLTGVAPSPDPVVRTVVVGGMPGWQIALIAIVAALVAAVAAVLFERARSTRRRLVSTPA
jgi:hypothetical protein